ncbi:TetR/AcrR family transcriptional regulator [Candidatus Bipolaricaulota bacterium]|nr:TetR/AcrR family transcriptional regulator [Candidatus Bipolaricaulota bacterium]
MTRKDTDTRQKEIIEATLELLAESGTQNLTTAHIAERVGISEAALYRHFDGKYDIISSSIEFVGKRMRSELANIPAYRSAREKLKLVFFRHLEYIEAHPGNARLLFSDDIHFDDQKLRGLLRDVVKERKRFIQEMIEEGQSQGAIKANVDPGGIALMFIGLIQTKVLLWSLSGRNDPLTRDSEELWEVFSQSIEV